MLSHTLHNTVAVIGDVVASRMTGSRTGLQASLDAALRVANDRCSPVEPLAATVGDEVQGVFHSVGDAALATLLVRVTMELPQDVRFGIGVGEVVRLDEARHQDGPAWWAARDAIDYVAAASRRQAMPKALRTWVLAADPATGHGAGTDDVAPWNAYFAARDHLVGTMDDRDRRILRTLLLGGTQADVAAAEGISRSAVSQRVEGSGIAAVALASSVAGA